MTPWKHKKNIPKSKEQSPTNIEQSYERKGVPEEEAEPRAG